MANVFDQFDEVEAGNPFDEFDPDPQVEAKKAKNRKTLSAGERFLAGVRSPIDGGTQMAAKANKWLADRGLVPRLEKDPLPEIEQRRAAYEAGKPEGFDWANLAGQIVVMVLSGMNAREARNRAPRLFRDTVALCHRLWRSFDTPEQLAARALEHMETSPADLLPPESAEGRRGGGRLAPRRGGFPPGKG